MARMSVLLPVPDWPFTSTFSPRGMTTSASSIISSPLCCVIETSLKWMASSGLKPRTTVVSEPCRPIVVSSSSSASVSSTTRCAEANHSARRIALSTSQFSAICTCAKAVATCISSPSVSSPARYFGAPSSSGTTGESTVEPLKIQVMRACWTITRIQRSARSAKVSLSRARSSSSPPMSAMFSASSRTRVSS